MKLTEEYLIEHDMQYYGEKDPNHNFELIAQEQVGYDDGVWTDIFIYKSVKNGKLYGFYNFSNSWEGPEFDDFEGVFEVESQVVSVNQYVNKENKQHLLYKAIK